MFGVLVAGKLPSNGFQRVNETQFMIQIADVEHANHVVVYMTGEIPFPEGFGGAVYFNYTILNETKWIYLGQINNHKPSAIFKISNLKHDSNHLPIAPAFGPMDNSAVVGSALIGVSVEPLQNIDSLTPAVDTQASSVDSYLEFCQKMLQNFYNYSSSFAKDGPDGQQYIPLTTLQNWFDNFKRRLELNPNFWKTN